MARSRPGRSTGRPWRSAARSFEGMDAVWQKSLELLTSSKIGEALDLSKEPLVMCERYGKGDPKNYGDGAPRNLEHFLMARRLIEAGAQVVTLNFGRWDFHSNNFSECKNTHFPWFDHGMHALITDLHDRGLADDTSPPATDAPDARSRLTHVKPILHMRGGRVPASRC